MNKQPAMQSRILWVMTLVCGIVFLALCAGFYRVISLKIDTPIELISVATPTNSTIPQIATRGSLLDRRGRILAGSRVGYKLFVDPSLVDDSEELAFELGEKLRLPPADIERKILERADSKYVVIDDLLEQWQVDLIRDSSYKCVGLEPRLVRSYPHGNSVASLVGLVGTEHSGLAGLEHSLNNSLGGTSGTLVRLRDIRKQTLWVDPKNYKPKNNGDDVHLTIDVVIQEIATKHLQAAVLHCNAGGGRVVVLDPKTGDILAMTDILNPRENWTQEVSDPLREIDPRLGRNRCLTDPYEPGSTFKPFIWAAATELGKVSVNEVLPTPSGNPYLTSSGRTIRDAHYYGPSTWRKVLIKSLNSGMAIVAERLTNAEMQKAITGFGFGSPTYLGLAGETRGLITSKKNWTSYTQASVAMGQEIGVTAVQMAQGFCAFARDGSLPQLRLIATSKNAAPIVRQAITPEIAKTTRTIMGEVMTEGTGKKSQSDLYTLFGKSGTAQLPKADGSGYFEDRYTASFIAGAPLDNPTVVVICVIDDPDRKIAHYGGEVAGPVVRDIIDDTLEYLGVPPTKLQVANKH
ncbi:MAG TPA: penicillin-binding protein 2 [Phycisphaerales bacterium]|nr:penicillin-binding protein 2 [Phycisphaerales bacterium]|tara:strand:+ start:5565 stop:7295 length:1731 start_codon:yes stop_codon:yes gene_type:complete